MSGKNQQLLIYNSLLSGGGMSGVIRSQEPQVDDNK